MKRIFIVVLLAALILLGYSYVRTSDSVYLDGIESPGLTLVCRSVEALTGSRVCTQVVSVINDDTSEMTPTVLKNQYDLDDNDLLIRINKCTDSVNIYYYDDLEDNLDKDSLAEYVASDVVPTLQEDNYASVVNSIVFTLLPVLVINRIVPNGWVFRVSVFMYLLMAAFIVVCILQLFYRNAQGKVNLYISECIGNGMSYEEILTAVQDKFALTEDDALVFMDDYKRATE